MKKILVIALFAIASSLVAQDPVEPPHREHAAEAAPEGAGEHAAGEPSIIWKWINFAILAGGLSVIIAKTAPKAFAARTAAIQKDIAEAQQIKREAEARAAQMEARLQALGAEIDAFRKQSAAEMQQEAERIRQETAAQIKKVEQQAALEIESAGKAATRELRQYSADLALRLAEEKVRARLDESTEAALVDSFLKELETRGAKR